MGMFHKIYCMSKHEVVFEDFRGHDAKHRYKSRFISYPYTFVTLIFNV